MMYTDFRRSWTKPLWIAVTVFGIVVETMTSTLNPKRLEWAWPLLAWYRCNCEHAYGLCSKGRGFSSHSVEASRSFKRI